MHIGILTIDFKVGCNNWNSEFYETDEYKETLKKNVQNMQKKLWRKFVEDGQKIKSNMKNLLVQYSTPEKAKQFVDYFYKTFQSIEFPVGLLDLFIYHW